MYPNIKGISANSASIVAAKMVSDTLAKVIVAYSGKVTPQYIAANIAKSLNGLGSVVESSFRKVEIEGMGKALVGFVKTNREVRIPTNAQLKASYKVLSSNILMSKEDRSLWEIKKGKDTTYLARHGKDDLSELVNLATANCHPSTAVSAAVTASVVPEKYDFAVFVNSSNDVDYGFVLASTNKATKIVSYSTRGAVVVPTSAVIESHECKIDPLLAKAVRQKVTADTKDGSTADMETYYRELFDYDKDYMNEFLDDVREMSKNLP